MDKIENDFSGESFPLGATIKDGGVNFCIFSPEANRVELLLYDNLHDKIPTQVIDLCCKDNKTYYYWHVFVKGIGHGQLYAYRVYGAKNLGKGFRHDGNKVLVDPYAKIVLNSNYKREEAKGKGDNGAYAMKCAVVDTSHYDWDGDAHPNRPYSESVIYEMHVKGFTQHESSNVNPKRRGKFTGIIDKIPYLLELGVTAVELMPVFSFDEQDVKPPLKNYWGYSPINFFSPHWSYASEEDPDTILNEFRDMVKALHKVGIEVILDVVFNHTAEGGVDGPNLSMKGLANHSYYMLKKNDKGKYLDYSGCGNTLNANHSVVRRMIIDALNYWVKEMHVDGFRFDLASVLSRDEDGAPIKNPPILWQIESEPALASTKLIAEAWDAAGLYQVGTFVGDRWAEWNGKYRDDVRGFLKGDEGKVRKLASRIVGSPDLFLKEDRTTDRSIHFVTCHDGFTLNDLVSYNSKHNHANNEGNRDGMNENVAWNCGVEGHSDDEKIERLRVKQIKNFMALTFFSQGTPMLLMGDEIRRSQNGNNNAYCQDNEISWMDWTLLDKNKEVFNFTKKIIHLTQSLKIMAIDTWLCDNKQYKYPFVNWHGKEIDRADWANHSHTLAFDLQHPTRMERLYVVINAYWKGIEFELPTDLRPGRSWKRLIDTSRPMGEDILDRKNAVEIVEDKTFLRARSIKVFMSL
ncbi:glycogen debranching protein GlgX [Aureibacter tunicatorum]|uniref:Glycogen operon protein n=1 Tax=Aureibacter tunicatorum TaxID=866807 RepID=A0AAE4BSY4_9BACT|nr:glycogen debranching protein GlgX [Aureibacter tunicatorum]MDR6239395.1 glycogen operon protein [Aureibacter tunicatorum]BDD04682.1 glycogen operon protein GlgX homolog [Aureibacter tunicatorum]